MKKIVYSIVTCSLLVSSLSAEQDSNSVDSFKAMFQEGKTSGQLRAMYVSQDPKETAATDTYATAAGAYLKFETAKYNGINGAVALTYSEDIKKASGDLDKNKRNDELSSSDGRYAQLSEAYLAYEGRFLDYKFGRQVIDTPLADSDDIRMVQNSFEAVTAEYKSDSLNVFMGYLNRWQGVDAGLDDEWVNTGHNGTTFIGASYSNIIDAQLWYYGINGGENANHAVYAELSYTHEFSEDIGLSVAAQYLNESEQDKSAIEANIYGAMVELSVSDLTVGAAYNESSKEKNKSSFSGFGGGALFTSMDIMILDEITADRDATSYVGGASYALGDFSLFYAYGDFKGDPDSVGDKAHIVEQDMGVEYNYNDEFAAYVIYVKSEDRLSSVTNENDWEHVRVMASYSF
ncbi:hypothetical protein [Sulfurimonas sp.]|uniref:hypothetical protein n=1 Tax=Sulfurimonas sp. TaxID=2022749 RepID=UPI003561A5CA